MTFIGLILRQIRGRPLRTGRTATQLLRVGTADFTVAQKHIDDLISSTISEEDIGALREVPGVESAIGALLSTDSYDADNPLVIEAGLEPSQLATFGVDVLAGRSYSASAPNEVMLGSVFANKVGKDVRVAVARALVDEPDRLIELVDGRVTGAA